MDDQQVASTFLAMLGAHRNGGTADALTDKMKEIVAHLEDLHMSGGIRKSKATLTLTVDFDRDDGVYKVTVKPKVKLPEAPLAAAVFWATAGNGLAQQDPRQGNLGFTDVARTRRIVDVGIDAGRDN
ncbi:MAG: hypothetical protein IKE60_34375 [Reyranella sp.]|uniref:hypothetical protein n=1 Tax=Reyranella sp. TaxID=1929291 RepID=UPI0025FFC600|nr:hypothetical protein [Reyranella sp.]MBR2819807.1 hypothetical protein [Reyranella sp.]